MVKAHNCLIDVTNFENSMISNEPLPRIGTVEPAAALEKWR